MKKTLLGILLLIVTSTSIANTFTSKLDIVKEELNLSVSITEVPDPTVNAYTDGTGIFMHKGLMDSVYANVQSIQVVVLHEYGHIIYYHLMRRTQIILEANKSIEEKCISLDGVLDLDCQYYIELNVYTLFREHEKQADDYAFVQAKSMNLDPILACAVYKEFADKSFESSLDDDILSTHPNSLSRYNRCVEVLS